jgi:phosphatidylglycerol---prolipoprotein diacylglyceryl transferase
VYQVLLRIPIPWTDRVLTLHGYGAMLCLGFLLAILLAARRAKSLKQSPDIIYNLALACFLGGLIGARAFYVIQYGEHYHNLLDYVKIWEGGLTFYGGLLLAVVCVVGYLRLARLPVLYWLDIVAPSVALGEGFGRLGCFLNGCCFGDVCPAGWGWSWPAGTIPWQTYAEQTGVWQQFSDHAAGASGAMGMAPMGAVTGALAAGWQMPAIYPTQLLSFLNAVLLFALLYVAFRHKRRHGQVIFLFILLYGISRFMLEYLRADEARAYLLGLPGLLESLGLSRPAGALPLLTISQNMALVMVAVSLVALVGLARSRRPELQAAFVPPSTLGAAASEPPAKAAPDRRPRRRKDRRS